MLRRDAQQQKCARSRLRTTVDRPAYTRTRRRTQLSRRLVGPSHIVQTAGKRERTGKTSLMYLWIKALHVAFMVTWFAGIFYLPRLFIYHADTTDALSLERFVVMERRLFAIMTIGAVLTLVFGLWLLGLNTALLSAGWFHVKLALLAGLAVYHYRCLTWMRRLKAGERPENTRWLRWFNEIPVVFLLGIVGLAVAKPF